MIKKMPFILIIVMSIAGLLEPHIPLNIKGFIYGISLSIKSILFFLLPGLIFLLLFKTASTLAKGATKLIFIILGFVILSNCISTFSSYGIGKALHKCNISLQMPDHTNELTSLWHLQLPTFLSNSMSLLMGLITGIIAAIVKHPLISKLHKIADSMISRLLTFFIWIIPFFILGFIIKLAHDKILSSLLKEYAFIFIVIATAQIGYVTLLYLIVNKFNLKKSIESIKNMLPAALVGLGSMSSAAAMPLTLIGAGKNGKNPDVAKSCIPATVNIHLIGDCLAIPIFAFAVLKNFSIAEPSFIQYSLFALFFVLAKFSVAAIPGGGIIVMLPILEGHLGFTSPMMSLITALYILFDPVITMVNILGNGAFAQFVDRFFHLTEKKQETTQLVN